MTRKRIKLFRSFLGVTLLHSAAEIIFSVWHLGEKIDISNLERDTLLCTETSSVGLVGDARLSEAPCYVVFRLPARRLLKYRWSPVELKKLSE
jgi:hypothetical protein